MVERGKGAHKEFRKEGGCFYMRNWGVDESCVESPVESSP